MEMKVKSAFEELGFENFEELEVKITIDGFDCERAETPES